ncbi:MAG: periplasmic heavy metal sensor [Nitrospirae bacterium]|nr:periplasmic heavy metal sensor [Nitrospirota bacterium]
MKKRQLLSLVFLSVLILFSGKLAIAMGDMHEAHTSKPMYDAGDMGDMTDDDWCKNDPAHAMMHKMGKHMMNKDMNPWDMIKEKLNLSDEENEKLGKIFYEYRKEMLRKRAEIEIAEMDLQWLLRMKSTDAKTIKDTLKNLESLRTAVNTYRVDQLLKTRDFLSNEQYEILANYLLGWMDHHGNKRGDHDCCMHDMKGCR